MAKLRDIVPDPEPEESISSEEEDVDEEEYSTEEEGDSEEKRPATQNRTQPATPQKPAEPPSSPSEENESDTDSDSPRPKSDWSVKAIVSKPVAYVTQKSTSSLKKPRSKPGPTGPTSPRKSGLEKRPAEKENEPKEAKRTKRTGDSATEGGENSEKKLFQRLWSEEDEIVILKGMADYAAKKKADPVADIGAFLEFIKKSLHVEVTKTQLQDKVRRLKKKFENNATKEKEGKERTFSKPHEQTAYELSKKVWGKILSEANGDISKEKGLQTPKAEPGSAARKSRNKSATAGMPKKTQEDRDEVTKDLEMEDNEEGLVTRETVVGRGSQDGLSSYFSVASWVMCDGMKMVGDSKRDEMEEKWRQVKEKELEVFVRKTELMCEQAGMVLEAMRKSKKDSSINLDFDLEAKH